MQMEIGGSLRRLLDKDCLLLVVEDRTGKKAEIVQFPDLVLQAALRDFWLALLAAGRIYVIVTAREIWTHLFHWLV